MDEMRKVKVFLPTMQGSQSEVKTDLMTNVGFSKSFASLLLDLDFKEWAMKLNIEKITIRVICSGANIGVTVYNNIDDQ